MIFSSSFKDNHIFSNPHDEESWWFLLYNDFFSFSSKHSALLLCCIITVRYKSHTEIHTADVENLIAIPLDAGNRYWIRYYILKFCPFLNHIVCGLRSMRLLFIVFFGRHEILSIENKTKKQNKQPKKIPYRKTLQQ